ncbi:MAG: murein L,D-transpeptidase, partial [Verrucomicrobiaceae bacterium]
MDRWDFRRRSGSTGDQAVGRSLKNPVCNSPRIAFHAASPTQKHFHHSLLMPMKVPGFRSLSVLLSAGAALALSSCTTTTKSSGGYTSFKFDPPVKQPTSTAGIRVKMSTSAQRLYVVQGDEVLLATPICVGTASTPTPHGTFPIRAKRAERRRASSPGAGYPMTYWMEFYSPAYGMHWGFVKPYP